MKQRSRLQAVYRLDGRIHPSSVTAKLIVVTVLVMVRRRGPLTDGEDIVGIPRQLSGGADGLKAMLLVALLIWIL
jgi:hypothetical protein